MAACRSNRDDPNARRQEWSARAWRWPPRQGRAPKRIGSTDCSTFDATSAPSYSNWMCRARGAGLRTPAALISPAQRRPDPTAVGIDGFETHAGEFGCRAAVETAGEVVPQTFGVCQIEERQRLRDGIGDALDCLRESIAVGRVEFREVGDDQSILGAKSAVKTGLCAVGLTQDPVDTYARMPYLPKRSVAAASRRSAGRADLAGRPGGLHRKPK